MAVNWKPAPEIAAIAANLRAERHAYLDEHSVRIEWYWRDDSPKKGGEPVMGDVRKVGGLTAVILAAAVADPADAAPVALATAANLVDRFAEEIIETVYAANEVPGEGPPAPATTSETDWKAPAAYFEAWVPSGIWELLSENSRRGLIDELLCRCEAGEDDAGNVKLSKALPDFSGFCYNIERFGLWRSELRGLARSVNKAAQLQLDLPLTAEAPSVAPLSAFEACTCDAGHRWDLRIYGTTCPTCNPEAAAQARLDLHHGEEPAEGPDDLLALNCGHEMLRREVEAGDPCPGCELAATLRSLPRVGEEGGPPAVDYADPVTGETQPARETVEVEIVTGSRRKRTQHVPDATGFRERVDGLRFGAESVS